MSVLFAIDSYLSNQERADTCRNLIQQIRRLYPEKKILLLNKFANSWGLDKEVDYYYFHGSGFLVGKPPKEFMTSRRYQLPYIYFQISAGTLENWFPLVNVSDHVADVYNSFIITSNIAKLLRFDKVFKIEYDTVFDDAEFLDMNGDIESFEDYLFYGERQEGVWAKPGQYLIDVHIIGFSSHLFDGFSIVKEDQEYWDLCERVSYYGKWVEYLIPAVVDYQRTTKELRGTSYKGHLSSMYPKSTFDAISSPGEWGSAWDAIPKVCRVGSKSVDYHAKPNEIVLFYIGKKKFKEGEEYVDVSCQVKTVSDDRVIYEKTVRVTPNYWMFDHLEINEPVKISVMNVSTAVSDYKEYFVSPDNIDDLAPRFVFET